MLTHAITRHVNIADVASLSAWPVSRGATQKSKVWNSSHAVVYITKFASKIDTTDRQQTTRLISDGVQGGYTIEHC